MTITATSDSPTVRVDPTNTATLRIDYSGRLRGAIGRIDAQIEDDVITRDVFGTRLDDAITNAEQLAPDAGGNYDPERVPSLATADHSEQVQRFKDWLRGQLEAGVHGNLSPQYNPYLNRAYAAGVRAGETSLRNAGQTIESTDPQDVPRRAQTLDQARSRAHQQTTATIDDTTNAAGAELAAGLAAGYAATQLAEAIVGRLKNIAKPELQGIAHGQVVRTYNEASLDRFVQAGVEEVGIEPEATVPEDATADASGDATAGGSTPSDTSTTADDGTTADGGVQFDPEGRWITADDRYVCDECEEYAAESPYAIADILSGDAPMPVRDSHFYCRCRVLALPVM